MIGAGHQETALQWAASNDDVELIDALVDAGADIECPGSSINGGPPLQSATGYGQWEAVRRLVERGATFQVWHAAALGRMSDLVRLVSAEPSPSPDDLGGALWQECRAGELEAAEYPLGHDAGLDWVTPWSGETSLDIARAAHHQDVIAWLLQRGAHSAMSDPDPNSSR